MADQGDVGFGEMAAGGCGDIRGYQTVDIGRKRD